MFGGGNSENIWKSDGFKDLKNFSRGVNSHEGSSEHLKNCMGLKRIQKNTATVADVLEEHANVNKILYNENVRKNRLLVTYLIDVTLLLGKQELAFRGHDKTETSVNQGNFREIFQCLIKRNVELVEHASKFSNIFTGQLKTIQNEFIFCVSQYLKEFIYNEISNANFFSVIGDDTTDITEHSQCTLTIRFVGSEAKVQERFLGFFDVSADRSAESLF
jgi:hypothetical protein